MPETARLGRKRSPRTSRRLAGGIAALIFLLGWFVLFVWPGSVPSRHIARGAALQWVLNPNGSGSLLAVRIRIARRDGGRMVPNDSNLLAVPPPGFQISGLHQFWRPSIRNPEYQDSVMLLQVTGPYPRLALLRVAGTERKPPSPWLEQILGRPGNLPQLSASFDVEGMPAAIPPEPPRIAQSDLTHFLTVGAGKRR
jgi:hypothetical protein